MTYFTDTAANATLIERLMFTVSTAFADAAERHAKRRVYKTTMNELGALSNRELADLGISALKYAASLGKQHTQIKNSEIGRDFSSLERLYWRWHLSSLDATAVQTKSH